MSLVRFRPEAPWSLAGPRCGCSSSGRAPPCQGGGSEFEPRHPLQTDKERNRVPYFIRYRGQVVRQESAKLSSASSNLAGTSKKKTHTIRCAFSFWRNSTDRFEDLNATVRWTVACRQLDGGNTLIFLSAGKKNVPNLAGTCPDKRYLKCTLITEKTPMLLHRSFFGEINPFGFVICAARVKYGFAM